MAACSDDDTAESTSTTEATEPAGPSSADGNPPSGEEAAVLDAYAESWRLYDDFLNGKARGDPADYFDGDMLATIEARVLEYAAGGYELRGEAELSPTEVTVDGSVARLTDCQLDGTYAVAAETEEVVVPASTRPQLVDVRLVKAGGRWKVSSASFGAEGSCAR
jgi:hypothetical protein